MASIIVTTLFILIGLCLSGLVITVTGLALIEARNKYLKETGKDVKLLAAKNLASYEKEKEMSCSLCGFQVKDPGKEFYLKKQNRFVHKTCYRNTVEGVSDA